METTRNARKKIEELRGLLERARQGDRDDAQVLGAFRDRYQALSPDEKLQLFEALLERLEVRRTDVAQALEALRVADDEGDPASWSRRVSALRRQLESPRLRVFRRFLAISGGMRFLLDLRADILTAQRRSEAAIDALDEEIAHLFNSWFQQGFLFLGEVTVDSPYRVIHFLLQHELVHPMTRIEEMAERMGGDRRCFALYHRAMPEEPVVFIEVALTRGLARSIHSVLDDRQSDQTARNAPDTAIFYSINNAQNGLSGLGLGSILIFQVVEALKKSVPGIKTFATLSPIPGLWKSYLRPILEGRDEAFALKKSDLAHLIGDKTQLALAERCQTVHGTRPADAPATLLQVLSDPGWIHDETFARLLRQPLCEITYRYLALEKDARGKPVNPVANFHLGNGASVQLSDVNFAGNTSARGIETACSMMVNYVYSSHWMAQIGRTVQSLLPALS
ncbi:MAG: malonyl-CoA decarboxylase family protein [Pseudomonadota bacterium]